MRAVILTEVPISSARAAWLRRALILFTLLLLAVSWRLWTPQTLFPRVPLLRAAIHVPEWIEWGVAIGMVTALIVAGLAGREPVWRTALGLLALFIVLLMVLDQHRLQPWAYLAMLQALVLATCQASRAFLLLRLLTVSIYFYSGLSKLDYSFLHTLGQQFLTVLLSDIGLSSESWSPTARFTAAALFPLGELAIAIGFCFQSWRRAALFASIVLHTMLLVILGPWGLGHSLAVLIWNGYFIVQNVLLFSVTSTEPTNNDVGRIRADSWAEPIGRVAIVAAIVLPLSEPLGWFDIWPSWGLYSSSSERLMLFVHRRAEEQLGSLKEFVEPEEGDPWLRLRIDRWSLESLGVPIYPQNRFQLGVAEAVGRHLHSGHRLRVVVLSRSGRLDGLRSQRVLSGMSDIEASAQNYWLNTRPRGDLR